MNDGELGVSWGFSEVEVLKFFFGWSNSGLPFHEYGPFFISSFG